MGANRRYPSALNGWFSFETEGKMAEALLRSNFVAYLTKKYIGNLCCADGLLGVVYRRRPIVPFDLRFVSRVLVGVSFFLSRILRFVRDAWPHGLIGRKTLF